MGYGNGIKNRLELYGKSVAWLARASGLKDSTLRSIIARDSWSIADDTLNKICDALGVEPLDLYFDSLDLNASASDIPFSNTSKYETIGAAQTLFRESIEQIDPYSSKIITPKYDREDDYKPLWVGVKMKGHAYKINYDVLQALWEKTVKHFALELEELLPSYEIHKDQADADSSKEAL